MSTPSAEADTRGERKPGNPPVRPCRVKKVAFAGVASIPLLAAVWLCLLAWEAGTIYHFLKQPGRGWSGQVHRADADLGFAPRSGARGAQLFPAGPELPMRYDADGFRIPVNAATGQKRVRPLVLALGCSFTHGDATPAEQAYPFQVGQRLGGSAINAGCGAYGLAQALVLARRLVPLHQPDYLIVQYSPWLVKRAVSPFGRSHFGRLTTPYFYQASQGGFLLQAPVFPAPLFDHPISEFRKDPGSAREFANFYLRIGLPMLTRGHLGMLSYRLGRMTGRLPRPARDQPRLIQTVYAEIEQIAKDNGARMLVVLLAEPGMRATRGQALLADHHRLVDAQAALFSRLPEPTPEAFLRAYGHWRGKPPTLVDAHPNEAAHAVIAESIVQAIRGGGGAAKPPVTGGGRRSRR